MFENAKQFIEKEGLPTVGFLTITPSDALNDRIEASRRFDNLRRGILDPLYGSWLRVFERMKSGRIHYHLLVACGVDIRTGLDFAALHNHDYRTANLALRNEWAFWREMAPKYGWGRCELLPIRTNADAAARYVAKYVTKHIGYRDKEDKGARLFGSSSSARAATVRFSWNTPHGWLWRKKLAIFASAVGCKDFDDLKKRFGSKWGYHLRDAIANIRLDGITYPDAQHALADRWLTPSDLRELEAAGCDLEKPIYRAVPGE